MGDEENPKEGSDARLNIGHEEIQKSKWDESSGLLLVVWGWTRQVTTTWFLKSSDEKRLMAKGSLF